MIIILFWRVLIANWKRTMKFCVSTFAGTLHDETCVIHSIAAFSLDSPVAEHNLQLNEKHLAGF